MLKQENYPKVDFSETVSVPETKTFKSCKDRQKVKNKTSIKIKSKLENDYQDNMDIFLTLLLKNFTSKERYQLLNKLLTMSWCNPEENLENQLTELINKKKNNDKELKQSLDYEYFLFDFKNWKNYFLSEQNK